MAKILRESGQYLAGQSFKNARNQLIAAYAGGCIVSAICGIWIGYAKWGPKSHLWISVAAFLAILASFALLDRLISRKMDEFERARISFRKGATGETIIAQTLLLLPDTYIVINDLNTPYGNLDHVVVGPNGVFIIETKNRKGLVDSDGRGDLLLNEQPFEKPVINPLIAKTMDVRKKIATLCDAKDPLNFYFFKAVIAFPTAFLRVKWGQTGNADCVSEEKLLDYITTKITNRLLTQAEIEKIAKAFYAITTMCREFKANQATSDSAQPEQYQQ